MGPTEEDERHFRLILEAIRQWRGFDGRSYKPNYLKRRVAIRMRSTGAASYPDYLKVLRNDPKEMPLLVDRLTVHVTEFFRDPEVFSSVTSRVCPVLQDSFPRETWSVWSAGSSTGEEAYSLGIILQEWRRDHEGPDYEILGTDIDPESVSAAERGVYPTSAIEKIPLERQRQWFLKTGRRVEIIPECRRHVRFQVQDLTGPWEVGAPRYHLVFCRNLLIYLNAAQHQNLYARFARVIRPGGFLVLGRTEAMLGGGRSFFQCVDTRNRLYRRAE